MSTLSTTLEPWLRWNQLYAENPKEILECFKSFDSNEMEKWIQPLSQLKKTGLPDQIYQKLKNVPNQTIEHELRWTEQGSHHILTFCDPRYPAKLKEIYLPPLLLFVEGNPSCLSQPQIAIVGSRNPSPQGIENARYFAQGLASCGLTITSGLAYGIDAESHRGALKTGKTIAVLGSGMHNLYPASHKTLAQQITQQGAVISEFPLAALPIKMHFPQRNRIISGLSLGVLVVEATLYSGSLITARLASEQGKEVFAIPGSIHQSLSKGCHRLIQQGAKLVTSLESILEEFSQFIQPPPPTSEHSLKKKSLLCFESSPDCDTLLSYIDIETTAIDLIIERSGLTFPQVMNRLVQLELQGEIQSVPGGYCRKLRKGENCK